MSLITNNNVTPLSPQTMKAGSTFWAQVALKRGPWWKATPPPPSPGTDRRSRFTRRVRWFKSPNQWLHMPSILSNRFHSLVPRATCDRRSGCGARRVRGGRHTLLGPSLAPHAPRRGERSITLKWTSIIVQWPSKSTSQSISVSCQAWHKTESGWSA